MTARRLLVYAAAALAALLVLFAAPRARSQTAEDPRGYDLIDPQGKGYVTLPEYLSIFSGQEKALADFQAMDANGDQILTKEEFLAVKPAYKK